MCLPPLKRHLSSAQNYDVTVTPYGKCSHCCVASKIPTDLLNY